MPTTWEERRPYWPTSGHGSFGWPIRRIQKRKFWFGAEVRVFAPKAADLAPRVMKLAYGKTSALLEGDAENRSERQIADEQPEAGLLKVAHRGSATSTIPLLLDRVHPPIRCDFCGSA